MSKDARAGVEERCTQFLVGRVNLKKVDVVKTLSLEGMTSEGHVGLKHFCGE